MLALSRDEFSVLLQDFHVLPLAVDISSLQVHSRDWRQMLRCKVWAAVPAQRPEALSLQLSVVYAVSLKPHASSEGDNIIVTGDNDPHLHRKKLRFREELSSSGEEDLAFLSLCH